MQPSVRPVAAYCRCGSKTAQSILAELQLVRGRRLGVIVLKLILWVDVPQSWTRTRSNAAKRI